MDGDIDVQQELEAIHQYITVCQRKILSLQHAVQTLLYVCRDELGENEARRLMGDVMREFGRLKQSD